MRYILTLAILALAALPGRAAAQDSACVAGITGFVAATATERADLAAAVAASGEGSQLGEIVDLTGGTNTLRLRNRNTVGQLLEQNYPPGLRDAGVSGSVTLLVKIDEKGAVPHVSVQRSARDRLFDDAALAVARGMLFRPAQYHGCAIPAWVLVPITFQTQN